MRPDLDFRSNDVCDLLQLRCTTLFSGFDSSCINVSVLFLNEVSGQSEGQLCASRIC